MFVGHCVRFSVIVSPHIVPSHYVDFKIYWGSLETTIKQKMSIWSCFLRSRQYVCVLTWTVCFHSRILKWVNRSDDDSRRYTQLLYMFDVIWMLLDISDRQVPVQSHCIWMTVWPAVWLMSGTLHVNACFHLLSTRLLLVCVSETTPNSITNMNEWFLFHFPLSLSCRLTKTTTRSGGHDVKQESFRSHAYRIISAV